MEGEFNGDGAVVATKLIIQHPAAVRIEALMYTNSAVFSDAFDKTISREEFYGQLTERSLEKARGTVSGTNTVIVVDVEFKTED